MPCDTAGRCLCLRVLARAAHAQCLPVPECLLAGALGPGLLVDAGEGVADVRAKLNGRTSILIGQSGVGKSSLLNTLLPEAVAKVSLSNAESC